MTDTNPTTMPQSMFQPENDDIDMNVIALDEKGDDHIDECADHGCSTSKTTPPPSSSSTTDHHNKQGLQLRLPSGISKVDTGSKLADAIIVRVKDRVVQCKESVHQIASYIDEENSAELKAIRKRQQQKSVISNAEDEKKLKLKIELNLAAKRNEKLHKLEDLKVDIMEVRAEERHMLTLLVRRQKEISNKVKRDNEETPTQILNNSNYFTIDENECEETANHDAEQLSDDVVMEKGEKLQQNDLQEQSNHDNLRQQYEKAMTIEEKRLAARAEVAEEIRQAKEIRRHEMAKFADEREKTKLAERSDDDIDWQHIKLEKNSTEELEELMGGVTISTLSKLLDCAEEEIFDPDFSDSSFKPTGEIMENSTADADTVKCTIAGHVQAIVGYDTKLSDIELMQSIILAENAALKGNDEFKTGDGEQLNNIMNEYSFSPTNEEYNGSFKQEGPLIANFAPLVEHISKRAGLAMKSFRLTAAKVDRQQRMEQKRRVTAQ